GADFSSARSAPHCRNRHAGWDHCTRRFPSTGTRDDPPDSVGNRAGSRALDAHWTDPGDAVRTAPVFIGPRHVLSEPFFPDQDGAASDGTGVSIHHPSQSSQLRRRTVDGSAGGVHFSGALGRNSGGWNLYRICIVSILDIALWVQST